MVRYNKRKIKKVKLIKELFYQLIQDTGINLQAPIKIRLFRTYKFSFAQWYARKNIITRYKVGLNLRDLNHATKKGYSDNYYFNRKQKLNFLINNRKITIRFIMLHELKHCIDVEKLGIESFNKLNTEIREKSADDWAIEKLGLKERIKFL